jgi:hypothetical protein
VTDFREIPRDHDAIKGNPHVLGSSFLVNGHNDVADGRTVGVGTTVAPRSRVLKSCKFIEGGKVFSFFCVFVIIC